MKHIIFINQKGLPICPPSLAQLDLAKIEDFFSGEGVRAVAIPRSTGPPRVLAGGGGDAAGGPDVDSGTGKKRATWEYLEESEGRAVRGESGVSPRPKTTEGILTVG